MEGQAHIRTHDADAAPRGARFAVEGPIPGQPGRGRPPEPEREETGQRSYARLVTAMFVGYMAFAIGLYLWRGIYFTPDRWVVFLLVGALLVGRLAVFLRDWIPFVLLIFGYEVIRGIAGTIVTDGDLAMRQDRTSYPNVQLEGLIAADRALFNDTLPMLWLQERVYVPGVVHWYDLLAILMYGLHFVFPLVFAFMLWLGRKERFWQFSLAFLFMTYVAFVFFLLYPAAPPWLAHRWGLIDGLQYPFDQAIRVIAPQQFQTLDTVSFWGQASPNPVAAMPSLHAAFPWLVTLFAVKFYGWRGAIFLVYNAALWFSIVYLSQHWVVDIFGGIAWATITFIAIQFLWPTIMRGVAIPLPPSVRSDLAYVRARYERIASPVRILRERISTAVRAPFRRSDDHV